MAGTGFENTKWKHLKVALSELEDGLRCGLCKKVASDPLSYHCGHFFCDGCACPSESLCPVCKVPSQASEIRPDRIISDVIGCFTTLSSIVTADRLQCSEDAGAINEDSILPNEKDEYSKNKTNIDLKSDDLGKSVTNERKRSEVRTISNTKTDDVKATVKKMIHTRSGSENADSTATESLPDKARFLKPSRTRKVSVKKAEALETDSCAQRRSSLPYSKNDFVEKKSASKTANGQQEKRFCPESTKSVKQDKRDLKSSDESMREELTTPKKPRGRPPKQKTNETNQSPVVFTPSRKSNTPGKELTKRNHKGETALHVACIKGNIERIRALLEAKASPNTKDNAGWTPLHEASIHGYSEVVGLLLKAGALVDVPGAGNVTPLHEAVINNHVSVVNLLVSYGANIHARSSEGKTPIELATSDEIKDALLNTKKISEPKESDVSILKPNAAEQEMVLCGSSELDTKEKELLLTIASSMNVKLVHTFGSDVTHLIVPSDERSTCPPSLDVLCAILKGAHILTRNWLHMSGEIDDELFELAGVTDFQDADAPRLSRINAQKQLPRLFNGCHFFVTSNVHCKLLSCSLSKADIIALIKCGGGIVLKRQPDPEAIPVSEQTVPYHAPQSGDLTATSHFILYSPGKGEPVMKYNMKHCKTLPVDWFINCVLNWRLLDP